VLAFERKLGKSTVRCAVNLGPHDRRLRHAASFAGTTLFGGLRGDVLPAFSAIAVRV
jgi:hypothetical protein